jgi:2',3'-cyclic-nucleotide 2'-phosphodiesterase/3'-nucleotidase
MKNRRFFYLALIMTALLTSCHKPQPVHIKMVCTSDVHGNFFPYDFRADKPASGSLARVSSYLNELRSSPLGDNVVLLDNGDILQGQPTAYYYNTVAIEHKHLASEVLNYLKCDVAMLGNHDIETGGPTYQRYIGDLECAVVGGNIYLESTDVPFVPPYVVVERSGVRIAIIGLTTPAIPNWLPRVLWKGLEFHDMESAAKHWMQYVNEHESPDLIVGLFHSGYEGGITTNEYKENAARDVAVNVPGFDVVFFGHDHQAFCDKVENVAGDTVWLLNPANNANQIAVLDVEYKKGSEPHWVLKAELVNVNAYEPDTAYMSHFASHMERVKKYVSKKLGESTHRISSRDAYFGPSDFIDFIHRMQLDITKAEVSFAAPLAFSTWLPEGDIHVRDMFNLYRYENMLYVMQLTGQEIKNYLEMSYGQWTNQMKSPNDHLLLFDESTLDSKKPRLKNIYYNFDSAAGIIYEVDVTKPVGSRVRIKSMANGDAFTPNRTYRVALNSYRGNGGGELLTKGAGVPHDELENRLLYSTDVDLRFYMINYIEMRGSVDPKSLNQWKFVPEKWTLPAAERDYKLLFENK